jgi:arginase
MHAGRDRPFAVIDLPSSLGLRPSGVERLPSALRANGLVEGLGARDAGQVPPSAVYDARRDPETGLLNGPALRDTMRNLSQAVASTLHEDAVPLVLAGDCSVVLGGLLGLRHAARSARRAARPGLLFVDGHVDFYQPEASPTGEVADMDLALTTGRGPEVLARLDPSGPLVRDDDVAAVGSRDRGERHAAGSQDVEATDVHLFELDAIRDKGIEAVTHDAVAIVADAALEPGFWLHLDADVLDDAVMPAVDYRQPGGLTTTEVVALLHAARGSGRLCGVSVSIYNPAMDPTGECGRTLTACLIEGLR